MVTEYGMVPSLGTIRYASEEGYQKGYSEKTGKIIDSEIRNIIDDQYKTCKELLDDKRDLVAALAERLLEKETISLPDIVDVLGPRPFPQKAQLDDYLLELRERDL
mmetsp:Transcript_29901/g.45733  ORF Transcript_29901/g.45733 Transcript_29901/m.45733 type:complete len:106 (+) Transcript_29901:2135-2452(+)